VYEDQPVGGGNSLLQLTHGLRDAIGGFEVAVVQRYATNGLDL